MRMVGAGHRGIAYLTGAGHFAASLGILFAILPRLAATLEAIEPRSRLQWTMLFVASALAGAAWITARSLRGVGLAPAIFYIVLRHKKICLTPTH